MSELREKRLSQLSLDRQERKIKVNVMNEETFIQSIAELNSMSLDEFNELLLQKPNTVIDKIIEIDEKKSCQIKGCEYITVNFRLMFNYRIEGWELSGRIFNFENVQKIPTRIPSSFVQYTTRARFLSRNGGVFYLDVKYVHHLTDCKKSYHTIKIKKTPWSLAIPRFKQRFLTIDEYLHFLKKVKIIQEEMKPTVENYFKTKDQFNFENNCSNEHDTFCQTDNCYDIENCDRYHYETEEDYCFNVCDEIYKLTFLNLFLSHPHFPIDQNEFCMGNQLNKNAKLRDLESNPNPISFISEWINIINSVTIEDVYYRDEYMLDVFTNTQSFNIRFEFFNKFYKTALLKNRIDGITIIPTLSHMLNPDCYCLSCMVFRFYLYNGLKYDPKKLLFGKFVEVTKEEFHQIIDFWNEKLFISDMIKYRLVEMSNIKINDEEYHVSLSPFNLINQFAQDPRFEIGIHYDRLYAKKVALVLADIGRLYNLYKGMIDSEKNFNVFSDCLPVGRNKDLHLIKEDILKSMREIPRFNFYAWYINKFSYLDIDIRQNYLES